MGTRWEISIWDDVAKEKLEALQNEVIARSSKFDQTYSRFITTSLISELAMATGIRRVPCDLVEMLRWYERLWRPSGGMLNPLIGNALADLGYDAEYSLIEKSVVRAVPDFFGTVQIVDDTHIELRAPALIDLGALGKGYFVDQIFDFLRGEGISRYLVDGSGDIRYAGENESIRVGLEHPDDPKKVIGVLEMKEGALCGSAGNRRKWGSASGRSNRHHIVNPRTLESPTDIIAAWVLAERAVLADALATALFFVEPEAFQPEFSFEYCLVNAEYKVKRSIGFTAELF